MSAGKEGFKHPSLEIQFMGLLEDLGIVAPVTGKKYTFEDALSRKNLILPDVVIDALVLFTLAYTALQLKLV